MTRVKRGTASLKRRKNTLKMVKGYRFGRGTKEREAKVAIAHAGVHAFRDRRDKKNVFRKLWQVKINAASRVAGIPYSKFIDKLKKSNIELDRKILATLAEHHPEIFTKVVAKANESVK